MKRVVSLLIAIIMTLAVFPSGVGAGMSSPSFQLNDGAAPFTRSAPIAQSGSASIVRILAPSAFAGGQNTVVSLSNADLRGLSVRTADPGQQSTFSSMYDVSFSLITSSGVRHVQMVLTPRPGSGSTPIAGGIQIVHTPSGTRTGAVQFAGAPTGGQGMTGAQSSGRGVRSANPTAAALMEEAAAAPPPITPAAPATAPIAPASAITPAAMPLGFSVSGITLAMPSAPNMLDGIINIGVARNVTVMITRTNSDTGVSVTEPWALATHGAIEWGGVPAGNPPPYSTSGNVFSFNVTSPPAAPGDSIPLTASISGGNAVSGNVTSSPLNIVVAANPAIPMSITLHPERVPDFVMIGGQPVSISPGEAVSINPDTAHNTHASRLRWRVVSAPVGTAIDPTSGLITTGSAAGTLIIQAYLPPAEGANTVELQSALTANIFIISGIPTELSLITYVRAYQQSPRHLETDPDFTLSNIQPPGAVPLLGMRWVAAGANSHLLQSAGSVMEGARNFIPFGQPVWVASPPTADAHLSLTIEVFALSNPGQPLHIVEVYPNLRITPATVPVNAINFVHALQEGLIPADPNEPIPRHFVIPVNVPIGISGQGRMLPTSPLTDYVLVSPGNATHNDIDWVVDNPGGIPIDIDADGYLTAFSSGTFTLHATITHGISWFDNFYEVFTFTVFDENAPPVIPPVSHITNVPLEIGIAQAPHNLADWGVIWPFEARQSPGSAPRTIEWILMDPGTTGAMITGPSDNRQLQLTSVGEIMVRASVAGGIAPLPGSFTQDFTITVSSSFYPVTGVPDFPSEAEINTTVFLPPLALPSIPARQINWTLLPGSGTGAVLQGSNLTTGGTPGTVLLEAHVTNGLGGGADWIGGPFPLRIFDPDDPTDPGRPQPPTPPEDFVPLVSVSGIPATRRTGVTFNINNFTNFNPSNAWGASFGTRIWSIVGTTGDISATITAGGAISTSGLGSVTVQLRIPGAAANLAEFVSAEFAINFTEDGPDNLLPGGPSGPPPDPDTETPPGVVVPGAPAPENARIVGIANSAYLGRSVRHNRQEGANQQWVDGSIVSPGDTLTIYLFAGMFIWEGADPDPNAAVTRGHLASGNITFNMNRRMFPAVQSVGLTGGNSPNSAVQLQVNFVPTFNSTVDRDFEANVFIAERGRRDFGSQLQIYGTMQNRMAYIDSYDDLFEENGRWYFDMRDIPVIRPTRTFRRVGLILDYGVTVYATLTANRSVHLAARSGLTSDVMSSRDQQLYLTYNEIVQIIHIDQIGLNAESARTTFDVDEMDIRTFAPAVLSALPGALVLPIPAIGQVRLFQHDGNGNYLGPIDRPDREFPFFTTYVTTDRRVNMSIAAPGAGGTTDVDLPELPAPQPGWQNDNFNPGTGAGFSMVRELIALLAFS